MTENKPSWSDVPTKLVTDLEDLLHGRISQAHTVRGGYGPSATFAIRTDANKAYFCKGSHPGHTADGIQALRRERAAYEALPQLQQFAPAYHGAVESGDWQLLVFDLVENLIPVPPWTDDAFRQVLRVLARFHASTPAGARRVIDSLDQIFRPDLCAARRGWKTLHSEPSQRQGFLSLFVNPEAAGKWFNAHIESFVELESQAAGLGGPVTWIHPDLRSDNILFRRQGHPLLIDWPDLSLGPTLIDVAFLLPSICGEGGLFPSDALRQYERESGVQFSDRDVQIAAATVAGFFAARAGEPDIPGLPRLRWVQRLQLAPGLAWLSDTTQSPPPPPLKPLAL